MKSHVKIRFDSRKKDVFGQSHRCELQSTSCCTRFIEDIHHIECSYRGKRKRNEKPEDLIWVCRWCHNWIHKNNNFSTREMLKERVLVILKNIRWQK